MYLKRNNELEIIALYVGDYKKEYYLRQISKLAKLPLKTCQRTLVNLGAANILKGKIEGKNKYFALNKDNLKTKSALLHAEIYRTDRFLERYPLIRSFLKSVDNNVPIIVFGSFAGFSAGKDSDLDLLIVASKEQDLPSHLLPYKIHQITLSEDSFSKALKGQETFIKELEEKHIILNNHSFYVATMWAHYGKQ